MALVTPKGMVVGFEFGCDISTGYYLYLIGSLCFGNQNVYNSIHVYSTIVYTLWYCLI